MDEMVVASTMCTAVFEGDLVKLKRLLRAGAPPDACDYDKRAAIHIAAAEGNVTAVKLLIEDGGADPEFEVMRG
jgi:ankyrin repeat protein